MEIKYTGLSSERPYVVECDGRHEFATEAEAEAFIASKTAPKKKPAAKKPAKKKVAKRVVKKAKK